MHPIITIGSLQIPGYGLFVGIGVIACIIYSIVVLKCVEKVPNRTLGKTAAVFIPSLILLYIFALLFDGLFHSIQNGKLALSGITWEGGVVGGFIGFILLAHFLIPEKKGDILHYFSLIVPGVVLGHAFGRIGCYMGGCCYGKIDFTFGVTFPEGSLADLQHPNDIEGSLPVLPTQLYEAAFEFALFAFMLIFYKKLKHHNLEIYCIVYGVFRFILEFFRGDDRGSTGFFLSPSQMMSIILIVAGILIILYERKIVFKKLAARAEEWRNNAGKPAKINTSEYVYDSIEKLKSLYDSGAITEEEFNKKKTELLERL